MDVNKTLNFNIIPQLIYNSTVVLKLRNNFVWLSINSCFTLMIIKKNQEKTQLNIVLVTNIFTAFLYMLMDQQHRQ